MQNTTVSTGPYSPVATITGPTTIVPTEFALFNVDATNGSFTLTLPPAAGAVGLPIPIKAIHSNSNLVTIQPSGQDLIEGATSITLGPSGTYPGVTLVSDDAVWRVAGMHGTQSTVEIGSSWCRLPLGWNTAWKAAKLAGTGSLMIRGDSIGAGQNSSNWLTNSFFEKLRSYLTSTGGLTLAADFYPAQGQNPYFYSPGVGSNGWCNQSAGPTNPPYEGGFDRVWNVVGTTATEQFISPYSCSAIDIIYTDFNSGTWTFTIDGGQGGSPTVTGATWTGSAWQVTTTGPNTTAGAVIKRVRIAGLSSAVHTLVIGNPSASNVCVLSGAVTYPAGTAASGFGFYRHVSPGIAAVDLTTPAGSVGAGGLASFPPDKIGAVAGTGLTAGINFSGAPCSPTACIIELGVNDCDFGINLEAFRLAVAKYIMALRRASANCSILILAPSLPGSWYSDDQPSGTRANLWPRYKAVLRDLAMTYGCAYVDIDAKWGGRGYTLGFQANNDLHPLDAGHADIATVLEALF